MDLLNIIENEPSNVLHFNNIPNFLADKGTDNLSVFHTNIRSIAKNFDHLCVILQSCKKDPDIIILSETWHDTNFLFTLPGYHSFFTNIKYNQNSGIYIFIKKIYKVTVKEIPLPASSSLLCNIIVDNNCINLLAVYRSPSDNDIANFTKSLINVLKKEFTTQDKVCIIGDLNIDISETNTIHEKDYYESSLSRLIYIECA